MNRRFCTPHGELRDEKRGLYELLVGNAEALVKQARGMERYFTEPDLDFLRVNEFKSEFDRLNTSRIKTVFTTLDTVQARRRALKRLGKELASRLAKGEIALPFKLADMFKDDGLEVWAADMLKKLKAEELDDWTISTNAEYVKLVNVMLAVVAAEDERLSSQESDAQKKIQAAIGDQESITGDLRNRAKERYEKAFANQASYRELAGEFERLRGERQDIIGSIEDCCKRIFATRDQAIGRIKEDVGLIEDEEFRIGLVLRQLADRRSFASALEESRLGFHGNWRAERRVEVLAQNLTPFAFVAAIIKCGKKAFVGLGAEFDGQTCGVNHAERLVTDNTPMSTVEGLGVPRVDTEKLDRLLRLENGPVDDEFFITLGDKPIQNCSPGQRCSAMLPIVTLTNQAPLIIDQPEDNLDNRLVSHALFKILARLKETRQIILATHNPNILVSGDAEQVLLLDGTGDLACHGCIDHPPIVESVIGLMEGGAEAFELRRKRYQPFLPSPK